MIIKVIYSLNISLWFLFVVLKIQQKLFLSYNKSFFVCMFKFHGRILSYKTAKRVEIVHFVSNAKIFHIQKLRNVKILISKLYWDIITKVYRGGGGRFHDYTYINASQDVNNSTSRKLISKCKYIFLVCYVLCRKISRCSFSSSTRRFDE